MKKYDIKDVAIYLRKSRGEEEDLLKHRSTLEELCKKNAWRYLEYSEIGTSDSITLRPEMTRLLADVKDELFDAVVVMDLDRLSRGDSEDQGRIKNTLRNAETLIITPQKIYDLSDDSDDMMSDFEGLMARYEYKQIKKRFKRGKRAGTKLGKWTTGFAPFPYDNSRDKTGLVINQEEYAIFRRIVDLVIKEGMRPQNISTLFNREGLLTRKGTHWSPSTVYRIINNEVILGKVIGNKFYNLPNGERGRTTRDEWVVVDNCHEPVVTLEEFNAMKSFTARRYLTKPHIKVFRLSSLVYCGDCGAVMTMVEYKSGESIKACNRCDKYGSRCRNHGGNTADLEDAIIDSIRKYSESLRDANGREYVEENYDTIIELHNKELKSLSKQITKIDALVEADYYTIAEAKERKKAVTSKFDNLLAEIDKIRLKKIELKEKESSLEKIENVDVMLKRLEERSLSKVEANNFYRSIVSKVIWKKDVRDGNPEINIVFN